MKRFLIILLIVCILVVATDIVLAKVSFGGWDKWDKELPPWDNKNWKETAYSALVSFPPLGGSILWFWTGEKWKSRKLGRSSSVGTENVFFSLTRLSFIKNKKLQASIVLFSPAPINKGVKGTVVIKEAYATAEIAIAAFPPTKGEVVIRAYEKKNGSLLFLEEWTVAFKNKTVIFNEKTIKFAQKYKDWLTSQPQQITGGEVTILPQLIVRDDKKKEFFIGMELSIFDGGKTKKLIF